MLSLTLLLVLFRLGLCSTVIFSGGESPTSYSYKLSTQPPTSTSTPSGTLASNPSATHTFTVGKYGGLFFDKNEVAANIGDIIEFEFYPKNHSIARAAFKYPCVPIEKTTSGQKGFWSGWHPLDKVPDNPPKFQVRVNDTDPIFFYCAAPGACNEMGAVGVINPVGLKPQYSSLSLTITERSTNMGNPTRSCAKIY